LFEVLINKYLNADQHFTESTRRNLLKGFNQFLMLLHCSVQCFGSIMHMSKTKLHSFSSQLTYMDLG